MRVLPESYRKLMSPADRAKLGQHTISEIRPKYEAKAERDLQKQIYSWLRLHGYFFVWSRTDKRTRGIVGTPDFIFCYNGLFVAIECKVGQNALTLEQSDALNHIRMNGGYSDVVRSFEEFLQLFVLLDAKTKDKP